MVDINHTKNPEKRELCLEDIIKGIGRKATDGELLNYLLKNNDIASISLESAFAKYLD